MKLLISDYDKTLNTSSHSLQINLDAVKKFMESGNCFGIATSNNFSYIYREIEKNKIGLDYLSVCDGLVLMDNKYNIVDAKYINQSIKKDIINLISFFTSIKSCSLNEYNSNSEVNVVEILGKAKNNASFRRFNYYFNLYFKNYICEYNGSDFRIRCRTNSVDSVDKISELKNIDSKDIYTIGNNEKDLEMIKKYNGYNMLVSHPKLYKESQGTVSSVKSLIKKIENY